MNEEIPVFTGIKKVMMKEIVNRATAPTPQFFKVLRTIGLTLLAVSGSIIAAPIALPAAVVTVAGYAAVAGGVLSAVSQITVDDEALRQAKPSTENKENLESDVGKNG